MTDSVCTHVTVSHSLQLHPVLPEAHPHSLDIAGPCTQKGLDRIVELLLKAGADQDKGKSTSGCTPLYIASKVCVAGALQSLLSDGCFTELTQWWVLPDGCGGATGLTHFVSHSWVLLQGFCSEFGAGRSVGVSGMEAWCVQGVSTVTIRWSGGWVVLDLGQSPQHL